MKQITGLNDAFKQGMTIHGNFPLRWVPLGKDIVV